MRSRRLVRIRFRLCLIAALRFESLDTVCKSTDTILEIFDSFGVTFDSFEAVRKVIYGRQHFAECLR